MKKLATLIATAVLGTSSIAAADPAFTAQFSGSATFDVSSRPVIVRDHRPDPRPIALPVPAPRPTWFQLGTVTAGRQILEVNRSRMDSLFLQAHGWVYLERVRIVFGNGQDQFETYNRWVNSAHGGLSINLAGENRTIKRIVVVSKPYRGTGSMTVFGRDRIRTQPMPASLYGFSRLGPLADGAQTLSVSKNLTQLALASNGKANVRMVTLHFSTGAKHQMTIDRDLYAGSAPLTIALPRYRYDLVSITVHSTATRGTELVLFGR